MSTTASALDAVCYLFHSLQNCTCRFFFILCCQLVKCLTVQDWNRNISHVLHCNKWVFFVFTVTSYLVIWCLSANKFKQFKNLKKKSKQHKLFWWIQAMKQCLIHILIIIPVITANRMCRCIIKLYCNETIKWFSAAKWPSFFGSTGCVLNKLNWTWLGRLKSSQLKGLVGFPSWKFSSGLSDDNWNI